MKPLNKPSALLLVVALLGMVSCGNQNNKTNTDTTTTTDSTTTTSVTTNPAPSTVTTAPQQMMIVTHKVADFNKWQLSYDAHDSLRLANGIHNYVVGRSIKDTNLVFVALRVDDVNKARAFAKDPGLKRAMQQGGVMGAPIIRFTTMNYQDTGRIASVLRSRTTFTVKDWNSWQRSFDSTRQLRKDNGIIDRAYGHEADDNHKVTVVVALMDTAKAFAFWKSDQMKQMQAASGVESQPERFIYLVTKRY